MKRDVEKEYGARSMRVSPAPLYSGRLTISTSTTLLQLVSLLFLFRRRRLILFAPPT